ncbi:MAG TPA: ATPase [Anaeromyxobacteraceae bacterium]|nr:ATPase [Anaeromyxobacteraceae bacterium]
MILPMIEVQLIGPRDLLPAALAFLQGQGVLQLRTPEPGRRPDGAALVHPCDVRADAAAVEARLEEGIARAGDLAARLPPARPGPMAEPLPDPSSPAFLERLGRLDGEVAALEARRAALQDEREVTARFERLVIALAPIRHGLDPALHPQIHGLVLRRDPTALALLEGEVRRMSGGACDVVSRPLDAANVGVLVTVPRAASDELSALLFERGVDEVKLPPGYAGKSLLDVLLLLAARGREIPAELAAVDEALSALAASLGPALAGADRAARAALGRLRATGRCGATRFAFVVAGWMPEDELEALRERAAGALGGRVTVLASRPPPVRWDEVPVVLSNRRVARPFQILLALLPLPRYGSVDPTPYLAVFFPLFFGLVLGDVAFGLVGIAVALLARARGWGGRTGRDVAEVVLGCSASALAFGVLYGEALGELGEHLGLHPVLLDRRRAMRSFLWLALAVGGAHVTVGMVLGIVSSLRAGHRRHAVGRTARLGLLLAGAASIGAIASVLPRAALLPAVAAVGALLVVAVGADGFLAALDLVLALGNVLSYARLMALGLASVMLAEVANLVAGALRPAALGVALGVLLHAVNFTLGLVSPAIAALRLHYVEFFEKFYDEGGRPYRPFALA